MAEALWPLLDERRWWPLVAARDAVAARRIAAVACASAVVALSYALAAAPGMWLLHHAVGPDLAPLAPTLGVPWLPVGIAVAGLLLFGPRASPGVFLGSCLTWGVLQGDPWISGNFFVHKMYLTQFHARMFELEKQGYVFERSKEKDEFGFYLYRLVSEPANLPLSAVERALTNN